MAKPAPVGGSPSFVRPNGGTEAAVSLTMLEKWKDSLHELTHDTAGHRFVHLFERQQRKESAWAKWPALIAAPLCVAIGVVLVFIPGPAFVFFGIAFGLLAMQSRWVARQLDKGELGMRSLWHRLRPDHGPREHPRR